MTSLAWSLVSRQTITSSCNGFNDRDTLELKGIFLSLDHDKDGYLNRNQVHQALLQVGLTPKEHILDSFFINGCETLDFSTFLFVLYNERSRFAEMKEQLDLLFSFIDCDRTGYISSKELEHLLCGSSKVQFTDKDFQAFVSVLQLPVKSNGKYPIADIKEKILFGKQL